MKRLILAVALGAAIGAALAGSNLYTVSMGPTTTIPVRVIANGSSDTASLADYFIAWNSASGAAKAESIPACTVIRAPSFVIKDEQGDAAANNITITPASGTIDGSGTYVISTNKGSVTLTCDGGSNYMVN